MREREKSTHAESPPLRHWPQGIRESPDIGTCLVRHSAHKGKDKSRRGERRQVSRDVERKKDLEDVGMSIVGSHVNAHSPFTIPRPQVGFRT